MKVAIIGGLKSHQHILHRNLVEHGCEIVRHDYRPPFSTEGVEAFIIITEETPIQYQHLAVAVAQKEEGLKYARIPSRWSHAKPQLERAGIKPLPKLEFHQIVPIVEGEILNRETPKYNPSRYKISESEFEYLVQNKMDEMYAKTEEIRSAVFANLKTNPDLYFRDDFLELVERSIGLLVDEDELHSLVSQVAWRDGEIERIIGDWIREYGREEATQRASSLFKIKDLTPYMKVDPTAEVLLWIEMFLTDGRYEPFDSYQKLIKEIEALSPEVRGSLNPSLVESLHKKYTAGLSTEDRDRLQKKWAIALYESEKRGEREISSQDIKNESSRIFKRQIPSTLYKEARGEVYGAWAAGQYQRIDSSGVYSHYKAHGGWRDREGFKRNFPEEYKITTRGIEWTTFEAVEEWTAKDRFFEEPAVEEPIAEAIETETQVEEEEDAVKILNQIVSMHTQPLLEEIRVLRQRLEELESGKVGEITINQLLNSVKQSGVEFKLSISH